MAPDHIYSEDNPSEGHINGSRNSKSSVIMSNLEFSMVVSIAAPTS
jgi:hypothetical protein